MKQCTFFGVGAVARVERLLDRLGAARVFLVSGRDSFVASGAAAALEPVLAQRSVRRFSEFSANPKLEDAVAGVAAFRAAPVDVILAVGGGSVLDMAKLVNAFAHQAVDPRALLAGRTPLSMPGVPVIAVPTTAGSGSEATHFAVVYIDRVKHSLASAYLLPTMAVIDPGLTLTLPPALTAATGMDAFSQAVESYWCTNSTDESKAYARRAIALVLGHLERAVHAPRLADRRAMSKAAYLAGRAINITKTTGAHALSYPLTTEFGIAHGHAVSLSLGEFLVFNSEVTDHDVVDRRGAAYVRGVIQEIVTMLGCCDAAEARGRIQSLLEAVGLGAGLGRLGISPTDAMSAVVGHVNAERMLNNPRALNDASIEDLVRAIC